MDRKYDHMISKYHHRFLDERLKDLDINRSEAPYIKIIYKSNQIKMNDLISRFFFHKSHTTRVIKALVSQGYIEKRVDPDDKRGYILEITESGKIIAEKIIKALDEWEALMDSFLEDEEEEFLLHIRKKIYDKLRNYYKEDEQNE
ncbi:MAG: MarR family transcriptional regulator [Candidatus Izemoplasmatales bacterium]|nr:MarR family transcriptional regulator [Candidatus Izemoplasmatales bacterium]